MNENFSWSWWFNPVYHQSRNCDILMEVNSQVSGRAMKYKYDLFAFKIYLHWWLRLCSFSTMTNASELTVGLSHISCWCWRWNISFLRINIVVVCDSVAIRVFNSPELSAITITHHQWELELIDRQCFNAVIFCMCKLNVWFISFVCWEGKHHLHIISWE